MFLRHPFIHPLGEELWPCEASEQTSNISSAHFLNRQNLCTLMLIAWFWWLGCIGGTVALHTLHRRKSRLFTVLSSGKCGRTFWQKLPSILSGGLAAQNTHYSQNWIDITSMSLIFPDMFSNVFGAWWQFHIATFSEILDETGAKTPPIRIHIPRTCFHLINLMLASWCWSPAGRYFRSATTRSIFRLHKDWKRGMLSIHVKLICVRGDA